MDGFFILADGYAKSALHDTAFSAMPDAPVLPYVEPKHRLTNMVAAARKLAHRPRFAPVRPAKTTDCGAL